MVNNTTDIAYLSAGCFWGVQNYFDQVPGVISTEVGYTGGQTVNPTYEQICVGNTGHAEAIKIIYDSSKINYQDLLRHFFRMHDPTQENRQGPDVGEQYRSAIFYTNDMQKKQAQVILYELNERQFSGNLATTLEKFSFWWPAEDYHQKYAERTGRGICHVAYQPLGAKK